MNRGKAKGDYASAYKLSSAGSTVDKKLRVHRRSLEQRELRQDMVNKRRPLVDLSPVQEGDQSNVNKNYKDKTPVKPKDKTQKGSHERLAQLMKWKKEREMKKKQETGSKPNPVFRVSKNMSYKDVELFTHSKNKPQIIVPTKLPPTVTTTKVPPVSQPTKRAATTSSSKAKPATRPRAAVASVDKQATATVTKAATATVTKAATATVTKAATATVTKAATASSKGTSRKRQTSGNQVQPAKKTVVSSVPSRARHHASPVLKKPKQTLLQSRNTRQSTRNNASQSKTSKATASIAKLNSEADTGLMGLADLSKVTNERGSSSFAPRDFSFNMSSFVFKPLSPTSAQGFLYPGQDNSCTSFLETNPKRASTPKKPREARRTSRDVAKVTDKCSDTVLLDNTALNMKGPDETVTEENSSTRRSRSSRQSRSATPINRQAVDKDVMAADGSTIINAEDSVNSSARRSSRLASRRVTRSSQRSMNNSRLAFDDSQASPNATSIERTSRRVRSQSRNASVRANDAAEGVEKQTKPEVEAVEETKAKPSQTMSPKPTIEQCSVSKEETSQENSAESESDEVFTETPKPAERLSVRKSVGLLTASVELSDEVISETPKETGCLSARRSVRRSTAPAETPDSTLNLRKFDTPKSALKKDTSKSAKKAKHVTLSLGVSEEEDDTPRRSARHARRSMPSPARTKESKKNQRKSMLPRMPKSPEEWVEFLSNSPMIEMNRRTPKQANMSIPALNFDDVDLEQPKFEDAIVDSEVAMETEPPASDAVQHSEPTPAVDQHTAASTSTCPEKMEEVVSPSKTVDLEATVSTSDSTSAVEELTSKPEEIKATNSKTPIETVQVGEISSTQGPNEETASEEHDVKYFRDLVTNITSRLNNKCSHWDVINADSSLTEDVQGQIRTTIGQVQLLIDQRFKQFIGLVDDCEFKRGERETTCTDLQGFWDMVYFQVEDVDAKFEGLAKLQGNNWVEDKPVVVEVKKPKKKVSKPAAAKPVVKSKFAAFRAKMKSKASSPTSLSGQDDEVEEKVFEIPGFFKVASPVRTPKFHCEAGTPKKAISAQRTDGTDTSNSGGQLRPSSNTLAAPENSENPILRFHARKSYVPLVPSPLLQDTTPLARPSRGGSLPKPVVAAVEGDVSSISRDSETGESASKRIKTTPSRRSLRPRKSVNFTEEEAVELGSPKVSDYLAPSEEPQSPGYPASDDELNISHNSFAKYLEPSISETSRRRSSRRCSLKACPSSERVKSSRRSVHFAPSSPSPDDTKHVKMPRTPYNRDSIVKQGRVAKPASETEDIFSFDDDDNDENTPPPASFRSPRPSLLFTPPERKSSPKINTSVPTATLISFTP